MAQFTWGKWATQNLVQWIDNDAGMSRARRQLAECTAETAEELCRRLLPDGTPDFQSKVGTLRLERRKIGGEIFLRIRELGKNRKLLEFHKII